MKVVMYLGHSIGTRYRTGVQRVAIGLAWGLRAQVPTDYVKWDAIDGQMRHLDAEDLAQVFGMDAPAPHRMSWRLNHRFSETIERPEETWFLYPEVSHHEAVDDRLAAMVAQARDYGFRTAAIFYDIIPITNSDYQGARGQHISYVADLLRFDLLLPISRWSRDELLRFLRTDLGLDWSSSIASRLVPVLLPERSWDSVMAQSAEASDANTVLLVGAVEPRKQQVAVLRTFTLLQESGRISRDLRAELYGGLHPDVNEAFHAELSRNSRITHHSFSTDAVIAAAYNRSLFSVFASMDEGFGLPITESLAHGVPCLTASFGAMREVAEGGGCRLVDVRDPAALAEGIADLANDPSLRASLRAEIAARRLRGWEDYARDVLATFAMVAEKEGKRESGAGAAASPKGNGLLVFGEVERPPGAVAGDGLRASLSVARFDGTPSDAATLPRDVLDRMVSADAWAVAEPDAEAVLISAAAISDVPKMLPGIVISGPKPDLDTTIRAAIADLWRREARLGAAALRESAARVLLQRHRAETAGLSEPLSIIVSTYNRGPFVEANAEWLLRITDLPGETIHVIVVDNASTDDTVNRLQRFQSHPRFTLRVNPQNVGMLGNLRVCASLASSRHVWLTGDDDFIVPEALLVIGQVLRDDPGLPLVSVNFAVYHRTRLAPQDRPELILKEGRPLATDVLPSGIYPLNQIATQHDNLFTAIYPLVFRTDLLRACFNFPFCGVPFSDLTESVPTTRYLLEACRYFECYWHAPVGVVGNAHNSWSRHRPRWHAVLMPQVFELAREAGADPVKLQRFAGIHLTLYYEALGIASDMGERVTIAPCELGAAHRVFRTRPRLPEQQSR